MTIRRAPAAGYSSEQKEQYRHRVWRAFRSHLLCAPSAAQVFLMPSSEGREIEVAETYGFRRCNMHVCDMNPAIVATLSRRFPGIHAYGVTVERAMRRIAENGLTLDAINLDLTCRISPRLLYWLGRVGALGVYGPGAMIGLNVMKGREDRATMQVAARFGVALQRYPSLARIWKNDREAFRMELAFRGLGGHYWPAVVDSALRATTYVGSRAPMIYGVRRIKRVMTGGHMSKSAVLECLAMQDVCSWAWGCPDDHPERSKSLQEYARISAMKPW